ncbi:hypothetical protein PMIN06_010504 [Paraphaeosphaeria minitans]
MPADGEFENGPTTPHHTLGTSLHPDPKRSAAAPTQPSALRTSLWPPCPTVHPSPPSIHPSIPSRPPDPQPTQPTYRIRQPTAGDAKPIENSGLVALLLAPPPTNHKV